MNSVICGNCARDNHENCSKGISMDGWPCNCYLTEHNDPKIKEWINKYAKHRESP